MDNPPDFIYLFSVNFDGFWRWIILLLVWKRPLSRTYDVLYCVVRYKYGCWLVGLSFSLPDKWITNPIRAWKKKTWISACPLVNSCHILLSQGHFLFVLVKDFVTGWLACTLDLWKSNQTTITSWILPGPDLLEIAVEFCSVHEHV